LLGTAQDKVDEAFGKLSSTSKLVINTDNDPA
jgi:hypothetical protein